MNRWRTIWLIFKLKCILIYIIKKSMESVIWFGLSVVCDGPFHFHASLRKITEMTGATSGEVTAYPSGAPEFTLFGRFLLLDLWFSVDSCLSFWPLHCLYLFDLQLLITPLISSNFSWTSLILLVLCDYCADYSMNTVKRGQYPPHNKCGLWEVFMIFSLSPMVQFDKWWTIPKLAPWPLLFYLANFGIAINSLLYCSSRIFLVNFCDYFKINLFKDD